jgi:hypothetical protein
MRSVLERALQKNPVLMKRLRQMLVDSPAFERVVRTVRARQLVFLDYPVTSTPRYGHGKPPHEGLDRLIGEFDLGYARLLEDALEYQDVFTALPRMPVVGSSEPSWFNGWLPALDMVANYTLLAQRRPRRYLEIGSGESTKLARLAIDGRRTGTEIISIDPAPRAEVDRLCDSVVRSPLEDADLSVFDSIEPGDFVFFDGSHRCLMNSDVAVFFLEILPRLPAGVVVGIHDIDLPWDHAQAWAGRFYNEQYLLATYLLARRDTEILFPSRYVSITPKLQDVLEPLWSHPQLAEVAPQGGAFWFHV